MKGKFVKSINAGRYGFFMAFTVLIFGVFVCRLVNWQIVNFDYYRARACSSNVYFVNTEPVRGEILDANGEGLAVNSAGYKLVIDRLLVDKNSENRLILNAINLLESFGNSWNDILPIEFAGNKFIFKKESESQIKTLKSTLELNPESSARDCIDKMIFKYQIDDNLSGEEIRDICSVKYNIDKSGIYFLRSAPYVISDDVCKDAVIVISERSESLKGLRIQPTLTRKYINGEVAPHIVGYTGFMTSEEYEKKKDSYSMDAKIGKTGIESVFEDYLRGHGGKRMVQMSENGEVTGISEKETSVSGSSVFLTLSSKLQKVACESLKANVEKARKSGAHDCVSGAAVAINVKDFSVLAAATYPSYDLSRFMEDKFYYSSLAADKALPLLNRAFFGAYAPGSIYKPLVAIAALEEGKITPSERIFCGGSFGFYPGYKLHCMGVHGKAELKTALAKSCNVYFAELGRRLGIETLDLWAKKFGIGVKTGVEVGESTGILAGPEHCEKLGAKWYESGSSQAAIGQSDNMFTPLQLAAYAGTIANGGKRFKTHLVSKITDYSRKNTIKEFTPELISDAAVSEENLKAVKEGMRQVAVSGTAKDFSNFPVKIAAKTGTAQNSGSDHTTFICFAPYEEPEIAIAVVIEHGKIGMASKNVARDMLSSYFDIKN